MRAFLSLTFVLLFALTPSIRAQRVPTLRQADSLLRREKWRDAAEAYEKITLADPQNGRAWFGLGSARHRLEDWNGAAEANERASKFPAYRATALYNLACAQSLGGAVEDSAASLGRAIEAGFLDFDLMERDPDLNPLRAIEALELPPRSSYRELKARNGIRMRYAVIEPAGFDPEKSYPVLAAFTPGSGPRSADWMMREVLDGAGEQEEWVVVCLVGPEDRGWFTHPSHHALEDVLRSLKKEYKVAGGRFHLLGYASGCRPALTYSTMSGKYFQSMTLVSAYSWGNYDDSDLSRWSKMPIHQIVGATSYTLGLDRDAHERLKRKGVPSTLTVVPDNGMLVESLRGTDLLAAISEAQLGH